MRPVHLALIVTAVALAGCLSASTGPTETAGDVEERIDNATGYELPDEISGYEQVDNLDASDRGAGMWIDEANGTLYATRLGGGLYIYNVSDPQSAEKIATVTEWSGDGNLYARDVDLMHRNGSTYAILAGSGQGIHVVDVTDPAQPEVVVTADKWSSHNVAVVPGTPYVYDSTGDALTSKVESGGVIPVLDLSNVEEPTWTHFMIPRQVGGVPVQSNGCHDVVVRVDLGQAYCAGGGNFYTAGGGESFIWNISEDPTDPKWVSMIDNPSIMYHHQAVAGPDGDTLLINDEFIAPNCHTGPTGTVKQSTAAVWIYDISDPENPSMESYVQASREPEPPSGASIPNCGSHFGDLVEDRKVATWGWYQGGSMLIDFSDPAHPKKIDRTTGAGSVWDSRYFNGHAFSNGAASIQVLELV